MTAGKKNNVVILVHCFFLHYIQITYVYIQNRYTSGKTDDNFTA